MYNIYIYIFILNIYTYIIHNILHMLYNPMDSMVPTTHELPFSPRRHKHVLRLGRDGADGTSPQSEVPETTCDG